ncbi:hypothetical protein Pcinc_009886 [Petrolisthes cinctipes]|uniref:Uncharacterized protein n=1 Tax=Petrolisthes cinctipes TaxID=88211 RepID=A0AAE1KVW9_PETCI|nr:hypothetical protein Pcinc_009886 [Petrolisthes cinctipes]
MWTSCDQCCPLGPSLWITLRPWKNQQCVFIPGGHKHSRPPPPGSAPGGFVSSFRPQISGGPPPGSAPGGFISSFRPTGSRPPPGSAPGGIVSSFRPPKPIRQPLGPFRPSPAIQPGAPSDHNSLLHQAVPQEVLFTFPDGTPGVFNFVADENGYRVESDLLPTPHPLPAHAIQQIEKARREKASGVSQSGGQRYG